jgi:hypothetical protein
VIERAEGLRLFDAEPREQRDVHTHEPGAEHDREREREPGDDRDRQVLTQR